MNFITRSIKQYQFIIIIILLSIMITSCEVRPSREVKANFTSIIHLRSDETGKVEWIFLYPGSSFACNEQPVDSYLAKWNYVFRPTKKDEGCEIYASFDFISLEMLQEQLAYLSKGQVGVRSPRQLSLHRDGELITLAVDVTPVKQAIATDNKFIVIMPRINNFTGETFATFDASANQVTWVFAADLTQKVEVQGQLNANP